MSSLTSDLKTIVADAMRDTSYNPKEARKRLILKAATDKNLRDDLLYLGADQAIRHHFSQERRVAGNDEEINRYTPRSTPGATPEEKDAARERKVKRRLFWDRYALFGQTPLAIAKRADLKDSEGKRRKQAAGNISCADFERDLWTRMKDDKTTVNGFFAIGKVVELAEKHNVI